MNKYYLKAKIELPFGNLYRDDHVLMAITDSNGQILLAGKKGFLPDGITRLPGGGVKDEKPVEAAIREMEEELNIHLEADKFQKLFTYKFYAIDSNRKSYSLLTHVFRVYLSQDNYTPGDDITDIKPYPIKHLSILANRYKNLDKDLWHEDATLRYRWCDYGKLYSPIHRLVFEYLNGDR